MANMISPSKFYIFNHHFGPSEETEHEKILYYYPEDTPLDNKQTDVGLAEAMVGFTRSFSPHQPIETLHTQKSRTVYFEPEKDYWIVMSIANPRDTVSASLSSLSSSSSSSSTPSSKPSASGASSGSASAPKEEFFEEEVQDCVLQAFLRHAYRRFKLFYGQLDRIVSRFSAKSLRTKLSMFFNAFLAGVNCASLDLFDTLDGVHFLPVDRSVFLRVQQFVNIAENRFSQIRCTTVLFDDHLIYSGLEQEDTRALYRFLMKYLSSEDHRLRSSAPLDSISSSSASSSSPASFYSSTPSSPSQPASIASNPSPSFLAATSSGAPVLLNRDGSRRDFSGYVTGPENFNIPDTPVQAPCVFLGPSDEELHMVVYQHQRVVCIFFIDKSSVMDLGFYGRLHRHCASELGPLLSVLGESLARSQLVEDTYRYIYFNNMNLALKTSLKKKGFGATQDVMNSLIRIHSDLQKSPEPTREIVIKNSRDLWLVGKKAGQREFFVIIDQKNASLIEINEEVTKLSAVFFNSIFLG